MNHTDLPYPEHTPPAAPEGMKWEYRGWGWTNNGEKSIYYSLDHDSVHADPLAVNRTPAGYEHLHYFKAVPILDAGIQKVNRCGKTQTAIDLLPFGDTLKDAPVTLDTRIDSYDRPEKPITES